MEVQVINHGIEHSQYFQGCGVSFTHYDDCFTGIGASPGKAYNDALEQIAYSDHHDRYDHVRQTLD